MDEIGGIGVFARTVYDLVRYGTISCGERGWVNLDLIA
jgi:hypothetical protein